MITCPNCGKDYELGRIFCLTCGTKLDLNAIAPPTSAKRPGIRKAKRVAAATLSNSIVKIIKLVLLAFSTTVITLVFLPPKVMRFKTSIDQGDLFEEKKFQLEDAINSQTPINITFTEREINEMLKRHTKLLNEDFKSSIIIGSIYVGLEDKDLTLIIDRNWKNFHIFLVYTCQPEIEDGKLSFKPVSGSIGRFPIPSFVLENYAELLTPIWTRFKFDKQNLDQLAEVKVRSHEVILIYREK